MRTLFLILLCVLAYLRSEAQLNIGSPFFVGGVLKPAASSSWIISEDYEAAPGYDLTEGGVAWTEINGTPYEDPDDATAPLRGSQSLSLNKSGAPSPQVYKYWKNGTSTNLAEFWVHFQFKTTISNANHQIFSSLSNGVEHGFIYMRDTARLILYDSNGSPLATPTAGVPTNTLIHVWAHWNYADGSGDIEWALDSTKVGSGTKYAAGTGGASNAKKANRISFLSTAANTTNWFDYVRSSATAIGSAPE